MIRDYALWTAGLAAAAGVATTVLLRVWDRQVGREEREARLLAESREEATRRTAAAEAANAERNRALAEAWAIVLWRVAPDGGLKEAQGWTALTGQPMAEALGAGWQAMIHPEDEDRVRAAWATSLVAGTPVDVEHRVRTAAGDWRWCRARGVPVPAPTFALIPDPAGADRRPEWVGVLEDVDERRRAEERRLLIAREVDHRAKNVLAVVGTILRLSRADDPKGYAEAVLDRIAALARAHDLLAERGWEGADLRTVAEREFAAYPPGVAMLEGAPLHLSATAVQALGMVLHEFATNAAKSGALSRPEGRVHLSWRIEGGTLHLRWAEDGGPPVIAPPIRQGFGTRVVDATVTRQLGGSIVRRWEAAGLVVEAALPLDRVLAGAARQPETEAA